VSGPATPYEQLAAEYAAEIEHNAWNALYERPGTAALLPAVAGRRVLDVGCGSGPLSAELVQRGADVVGFDSSPAMIRLAEVRRLRSASFRVADLSEPLEFLADQTFDVVVASLVFHYLRDWIPPLVELRRVLRPHGVLVISTHHPSMDVHLSKNGNYFATELIRDRWTKAGEHFDVEFWRRPLTDMFSAIDRAGFRVDAVTEPRPLDACRQQFPEAWELLTTQPRFIFFRLLGK
jgi:SAM-dependent methyltransferase